MGFVRHIAIQQPLVMLLDDLHWADEMSLRLLSFVVRRSQGVPILIVGTSRDDELESAPLLRRIFDDFDREARLVRLILSPLDQAQTLELVRALAVSPRGATFPGGLGDQVWAASEGHPFMIVETLREIWEGQAPLTAGSLPMPQRVRQLVLSRLYRLSDRARHLASVAAVIGREFQFTLLYRASGMSEVECAAAVEELVRRRVLGGAGELFDFVHDRVREVTYGKLNVPERRLLHGQVARALEEIDGSDLEPYVDAVGVHYREAEVWEKAHLYLRRAGLNAFWRVANREAVVFFEQALAAVRCLPRSEQTLGATIDVLMDLGGSLSRLDEVHRALDFLRQADVLARELNDQRRMGYVACHLSEFLRPLGAFDEAIEAGTRALTIASSLGDFTLEVLSTTSLGKVHLESGEFRKAREFFVRAISKLAEDGHPARATERSPVEALLISSVQYSRKWNSASRDTSSRTASARSVNFLKRSRTGGRVSRRSRAPTTRTRSA
jgi:predicted ATPase